MHFFQLVSFSVVKQHTKNHLRQNGSIYSVIIFDFVKKKLCCLNQIKPFQPERWYRNKCGKNTCKTMGVIISKSDWKKKILNIFCETLKWKKDKMKNFISNKFAKKTKGMEFNLVRVCKYVRTDLSDVIFGQFCVRWIFKGAQIVGRINQKMMKKKKKLKEKSKSNKSSQWKQNANGNCHRYLFK